MIERYCFARLSGEAASHDQRRAILAELRAQLADVPGVAGLTLGIPADDSAARWDLSIVVRFETLGGYEAAAASERWRGAFAALTARAVVIKAWNFSCER